MAGQVPALTLRIPKGSPLSTIEGDENWSILRDFSNALSAQLDVSLNPNGTLKNPAIRKGTDSGTPNAHVLTTIGAAITSYAAISGEIYGFFSNSADSGATTVNIDALGVKNLKKNHDMDIAADDIEAGQFVAMVYSSSEDLFQVVSTLASVLVIPPSAAISGSTLNLVITNKVGEENFKITIAADEMVLRQASNNDSVLRTAVSLTAELSGSLTGANALDAGTEAADAWYYIWAIWNGTTLASLFSVSATAPTLPAGYTHKALLGAIYNDAGSNLERSYQTDRRVWIEDTNLFNALAPNATTPPGTANAYNALVGTELTAFRTMVPPIARTALGTFGAANGQGAKLTVAGDANGMGAVTITEDPAGVSWNSFGAAVPFEVPLLGNQNFYWKTLDNSARSRINISGYTI